MKASLGLDLTTGSRTDRTSVKESAQFGAHGDCRIEKIDFEFECARDGARALTEARRAEFKDDVCQEIIRLQKWASDLGWIEFPVTQLKIVVSDRYRSSKSLVPAWSGRRGYMEFPTWRVASRRAAIVHELVHVFYPSGNRFLAEGLAVHLQDSVGSNPAFPNFGEPLHGNVFDRLQEMTKSASDGEPLGLRQIHLAELDGIATPSPLTLRVGDEAIWRGSARPGLCLSHCRIVCAVPHRDTRHRKVSFALRTSTACSNGCNVGSLDRWLDVYGITLADLEFEWKSMIVSEFSMANCETFAET